MDEKKKVKAVSNDTKGGKSEMSKMNPQQPDSQKPVFKGITIKGDQ